MKNGPPVHAGGFSLGNGPGLSPLHRGRQLSAGAWGQGQL